MLARRGMPATTAESTPRGVQDLLYRPDATASGLIELSAVLIDEVALCWHRCEESRGSLTTTAQRGDRSAAVEDARCRRRLGAGLGVVVR
jgi:hypothetical protein